MEACLDDPRVVKHHQGFFGQHPGDIIKVVFGNLAVAPYQELRAVALFQRVFRYALLGKLIVVIVNAYFFRLCHICKFWAAKVQNICPFHVKNSLFVPFK